jgi:hypothetical protein
MISNKVPGPGTYKPLDSKGRRYPMWSVGRAERKGLEQAGQCSPEATQYMPSFDQVKPKNPSGIIGTSKRPHLEADRPYHLPPGQYNADWKKTRVQSGMPVFGRDKKLKHMRNSSVDDLRNLGPGSHNPDEWEDFNKAGKGFSISRRIQSLNTSVELEPGPDKYNPLFTQVEIKSPGGKLDQCKIFCLWVIEDFLAQRTVGKMGVDSPGPGRYEWSSGLLTQSTLIGTEKRKAPGLLTKGYNVGPGQYEVREKGARYSPTYRFAGDEKLKDSVFESASPGPARYRIKSLLKDKEGWKIGTETRQEISRREKKAAVPGPGCYDTRKNTTGGYSFSKAT